MERVNQNKLIVLGDFNLPNIMWFPNDDSFGLLPSCKIPWICDFLDIISDCGLSQINYLLNSCNNILDLSFVGLSICAIVRSDPLSIPEDIFHLTFNTEWKPGVKKICSRWIPQSLKKARVDWWKEMLEKYDSRRRFQPHIQVSFVIDKMQKSNSNGFK